MSNTSKEPTKEQQQHIAPSVALNEHTITREQIKQVIDNALGNNLTGVFDCERIS